MRANDASLESSIKGGTHNKRCIALPPDEKLDAVPSWSRWAGLRTAFKEVSSTYHHPAQRRSTGPRGAP